MRFWLSALAALFLCAGAQAQDIPASAAPSYPVIHPTVSNSGCAQGHYIPWVDQNTCETADEKFVTSTDPSALLTIQIGGSPTVGDAILLYFTFGSGPCASYCVTGYNVQPGDTLASIIQGIANAIMADSRFYNNVAGAQGQVLGTSNYGPGLAMDFDSRVPMQVQGQIIHDGGGVGWGYAGIETLSIPAACATACTAALDVNPTIVYGRITGAPMAPGSQIFAMIVQGPTAANWAGFGAQYGQIVLILDDPNPAAPKAHWVFSAANPTQFFCGGAACP